MRIDAATSTELAVRSAMGSLKSREIDEDCTDIPGGWPRAYYRNEQGQARYTQWASARAVSQISVCNNERTWTASKNFACTSCAQVMQRGLFLDVAWMNADLAANFPEGIDYGSSDVLMLDEVITSYDENYDTHYGGAICHRCLVFALKHCPFFARMMTAHGEQMLMVELHSPYDYTQADQSTATVLSQQGRGRERISVAEIKARVMRGELYLTDRSVADAVEARPVQTVEKNTWGEYTQEVAWNAPLSVMG